ncbi:hypothetical protein Scep_001942 [Stephania cephalantha]|uniref:Uncharacterized protein n=1 Tax=Stephania cephalantha TaxID=152367 RepID=A0AAP0Q8A3_9MAGN
MSVREVAYLYGCEKSLHGVEVHRPLSGLHSIALSALERQSFVLYFLCDLHSLISSCHIFHVFATIFGSILFHCSHLMSLSAIFCKVFQLFLTV